ncbi:MAG TPA: hypothetical protein VFN65_12625 [Solirubrobacteraceae bacterium]|nr:hypothetical protein [Solirubrobacteraceae bacterium]
MSIRFRRSLLVAGVPLLAGLPLASSASAASSSPPVTVRVEGPTRTLLPARTVTAPTSGWVRKGGTPTGTCPADSAAGALRAATRGRWNGTFFKGLGIDVTTLLGMKLSFSRGSYWGFYVDGRVASRGICETKLVRGESLLFAPVPAKGRTPMPILVHAPRTVVAGRAFEVRAFVHVGAGSTTRPAAHPRVRWTIAGRTQGRRARLIESSSGRRGVLRLRLTGVASGRLMLVVSARGEIRSAAQAIRVVG